MRNKLVLITCAMALCAVVPAQINSGTMPINIQQDKLEKTVVGTAILQMRDRNGKVVASWHFQTQPGKCPVYRLSGFEFSQMTKLDNVLVDSVNTALFPRLDMVESQKGQKRPDYKAIDTRLDRVQAGPQTMFVGKINIEDAQEGDNAVFSHAVTSHREHVKILFGLVDMSKTRRNYLQDSLPVVIRDCGRGQEMDALTDMAQAGWEFTSIEDRLRFNKLTATMNQLNGLGRREDQGQDSEQRDPGLGKKRDDAEVNANRHAQVDLDLDMKPISFYHNSKSCVGKAEFVNGEKLEINGGPARKKVVAVKVHPDGREEKFFEKTYASDVSLKLGLSSGMTYRIEVRDPGTDKLLGTIRLEAKQ